MPRYRRAGEGRLRFTTDLSGAIQAARAIFIAVGTPPKPDGSADLRYVEEVARSIARYMNGPKLVITKSTVPIGTGRMIKNILAEAGNGHRASVVSNPEFLREGSAIEDFMKPDRVVIGASDRESAELIGVSRVVVFPASRSASRPKSYHVVTPLFAT